MFSFFVKQEYLVDHISGLVDIHNHILPGIDDGAKNVEESADLLKGFKEFGVTNFICTPHIMHNYYENTPKTIKRAYANLSQFLATKEELQDVGISYAAEHMIDDNFDQILINNQIVPLRTKYLLIEMSFLQPPIHFDSSVEKVKSEGFFPILAHPERYRFLQNDYKKYHRYKANNISFQANLLSLAGYYGKSIKNTAISLLADDLIDYVASDIHSIKQLNYLKETVISKKSIKKLHPIVNQTIETFY